MWTRIIGYAGLLIALVLVLYVGYRNTGKIDHTLVFSPSQMMSALWADYNVHYLEPESKRTLDPSRENITTSEGQSYTMLRAVWMGDKETFDMSWTWTKDNLGHNNDALFSWLYGKRADGTYGVLTTQSGTTSASDADTDIALALTFAYGRWQDPTYLAAAHAIIDDIWKHEVVKVGSNYYLASNNTEKTIKDGWYLINPSYFHPAAYRIFANIDTKDPWINLAHGSYALLNQSMLNSLDTGTSAILPPDWVEVNAESGALRAPQGSTTLATNFSFDALRTPWRIALDYEWFKTSEASSTLRKMQFLSDEWEQQNKLVTVYAHSGTSLNDGETPAMYGGTIGYFVVVNPALARQIYDEKLSFLFDSGTNTWKERLSYYDDNWAWFGIGLYNNLLPNLSANVPLSTSTSTL
jgi:endo-1,4-beta-D-glucanase Y